MDYVSFFRVKFRSRASIIIKRPMHYSKNKETMSVLFKIVYPVASTVPDTYELNKHR